MSFFEADNVEHLYRAALSALLTGGEETAPRGMLTRELRAVTLRLTNPMENVITGRRLNHHFAAAEFVWMLTGQNRVDLLEKFNSEMARFSDDGHHLWGAYGPPLTDQLPWVIRQLEEDNDTRQAVLTIWRPRGPGSKDVPCTCLMHFMLRDDHLEMIVYMRSNDIWLGFPYDCFSFTMIQRYVASALGARVGPYHHVAGSLHLYETHFTAAEALLENPNPVIADSMDLDPTYPWPLAALEALVASPSYVDRGEHRHLPRGWANIIGLLDPHYTNRHWAELVQRHGVKPYGWLQ